MKKIISFIALALSAAVPTALPQGTITFANRGGSTTTAAPGAVLAPFYREDPGDPAHRISGNTSSGIPAGNTSYNGAAFVANSVGRSFTAELWALRSDLATGTADENNLAAVLVNGTTTFRTSTSGTFAGIFIQPAAPAEVQGTVPGDYATFQVRVWDNRVGSITSWQQVLADNNILRGYSELFTVPYRLEGGFQGNPPPLLQGLQSFNLFIVPEPSGPALLAICMAYALYSRRRK
jgi:hypothetical protein